MRIINHLSPALLAGALRAAFFILHFSLFICCAPAAPAAASQPTPSIPHTWATVPIGGCGYVTGIVANRHGDIYLRSDMGGVMRWDDAGQRWINLSDMFGSDQTSPYSVDAIALDPSNRNVLYTAVGWKGEDDSDVLRSADAGKSWISTGWTRAHGGIFGNAEYRWAGERLAVDPNKPNILYHGTRENGLWKNTAPAAGGKWTRIPASSVPAGSGKTQMRTGTNKVGVTFVAFDPRGGTNADGETNIIYAGSWGDGVYQSTDAGKTWRHMEGSPQYPMRALVSPHNGTLYVTHEYDAFKKGGAAYCPRNGKFTESTGLVHEPGGYSGLSLHPTDPKIILVARHNLGQNNQVFRSLDGGKTFKAVPKQKLPTEPRWWPDGYWFARTCGILIDPANPKRVFTINWFGQWMTEDITANPTLWKTAVVGHEGSNPRCMVSPPAGEARLFVGIGDSSGFRWTDTAKYPERQIRLGTTDLNAFVQFPGDPNLIYCVGCNRGKETGWFFKSTDNGKNWTTYDPVKIKSLPDTYYGGRLAVSATDPGNLVWMSLGNHQPHYTKDGGATWSPCNGLPKKNILPNSYLPMRQPLSSSRAAEAAEAAEKNGRARSPSAPQPSNRAAEAGRSDGANSASYFYLLISVDEPATFHRSTDGGANFTPLANNGLPPAKVANYTVKGVPNQPGGVWVSMDKEGLYKSTNHGSTFEKIPQVESAIALGFGKSSTAASPAAVYIIGRMTGDTQPENRVYRSDDMGETWLRINDDAHKFGLANSIEGDGRTPGQVYIGTTGRGVFQGTEASQKPSDFH